MAAARRRRLLPLRGCAGPARRAGNFLLLAQKKVTKEEGLNTISPCGVAAGGPTALRPDRIQALFFGNFLLGQQKKVTRRLSLSKPTAHPELVEGPGRIPGAPSRK